MTIAYTCVLIMILFPYIFTFLAKISSHFNNHAPREYMEHTRGWRRRAYYVELNSFEALPAFGMAVIIAHILQAPQTTLDSLAIAFVLARVAYAICYLTNQAILRTLCWAVGIGCVLGIFYISY